ncbi:hypothetical protein L6164_002422 [Bauhinia variegata]|uniref:Uncharacterized protein n=1 Tax=Bauhinia variegata TaxID=167791 RepID=A0ACB9PXD2_BAUVA|nr:hypothetical protein L6164_002422 [Bauhinia variegata]
MGACCSHHIRRRRNSESDLDDYEREEDNVVSFGDFGARVRLRGFSGFVSMYSQQGQKGVNQDTMTVWEDFTGEGDMIFCGVFDGHGPLGHRIGQYVRDVLPSKLSETIKMAQQKVDKYNDVSDNNEDNEHKSLALWESCFHKSFDETDEDIARDINIDCFCSGSTAVTVIKQRDQLIIGNLGDSRAVLCTRGDKDNLIPVQLTVDLKPNLPREASRIFSCEGRVFAAEEEPDVYRIWMADDDCPGLAMSRAFGDFCLKDYGLISTPDVFYRKLTQKDEFVVLATDGIWDVLNNTEVINIVASAPKRSIAAKMLVKHAVRAWACKYPNARVDDCAVVCLFLKDEPHVDSTAGNQRGEKKNHSHGDEDIESGEITPDAVEEWQAMEGLTRANSVSKIPRLARDMSRRNSTRHHEGARIY